jgi:hypothetical protein
MMHLKESKAICTCGQIRAVEQIEANMEYRTPEIRLVMAMGTLPVEDTFAVTHP